MACFAIPRNPLVGSVRQRCIAPSCDVTWRCRVLRRRPCSWTIAKPTRFWKLISFSNVSSRPPQASKLAAIAMVAIQRHQSWRRAPAYRRLEQSDAKQTGHIWCFCIRIVAVHGEYMGNMHSFDLLRNFLANDLSISLCTRSHYYPEVSWVLNSPNKRMFWRS